MRSGFVALAGRPNVGKSTLVNALCGEKVAIVSDKPQTTRRRILGATSGEGWQLVLVDLPGFQRPLDALTERMQRAVDESFEDVDAVMLVLAADETIGRGDRFVARRAFGSGVPVVIVLNKVDRLSPARIAHKLGEVSALVAELEADYHALHPVSARTGDGIAALRDDLASLLEEGPTYFPEGQATDQPLEFRVAELVREQALHLTREEVPHSVGVQVEELERKVVRATIIVETESQKSILVGKGGSMIREIGARARPEIEALLGHPVYLDLRVRARRDWRADEALLGRLGL
ncbi:MAG: GTPase Era [Thermoleophilia bacterium]